MRIDAIILARGGSKGIPNKNLKLVNGKPLIFWTIEQLKCCDQINDIWVSSDSDQILEYADQNDAKTIKRPSLLANDQASSESAWLHAITYIEEKLKIETNLIVAPQVTSPIRSSDDFSNAIDIFLNEDADSLLSVARLSDYFVWESNGSNFQPVNHDFKKRVTRQDIPYTYLENGSIYIFKTKVIKENNNRLGGKIGYEIFPEEFGRQLDTYLDLEVLKSIAKYINMKGSDEQ